MHLTLDKQSALALLRTARMRGGPAGITRAREDLVAPDASPKRRWTAALLSVALSSWDLAPREDSPVDICVPGKSTCLGSRFVSNTVYRDTLPGQSFVPLDGTVSIACPELLFVELANAMPLPEHLLLGFELCGSFALDARDPGRGKARMGIPPATSVERISSFIAACGHVNGKRRALRTLELLADGAWSPMEAIVATMVSLPLRENGYGLGRCSLNPRVEAPKMLRGPARKGSRVPDIMIGDSCVGLNYDGEYHLDLDGLVDAAIAFGRDPLSRAAELNLEEKKAEVRAKVIDDSRRNRELIANGLIVFPVYREDLYDRDGFDATMMQVMQALRLYGGWGSDGTLELIAARAARDERRELLTTLLPGRPRKAREDVSEAIVRLKRGRGPRNVT